MEVQKNQKVETERTKLILETLLDRLDLLVFAGNKDLGTQLIKLKNDSKIVDDSKKDDNNIIPANLKPDEFSDFFDNLKGVIPTEITAPEFIKSKPKLKQVRREDFLGIHLEE